MSMQMILANLRARLMPSREIARLEKLAETAYAAMYDAPRYGMRDYHDDAQAYLSQAVMIAEKTRRASDIARLKQRKEHIYNVYAHQFR